MGAAAGSDERQMRPVVYVPSLFLVRARQSLWSAVAATGDRQRGGSNVDDRRLEEEARGAEGKEMGRPASRAGMPARRLVSARRGRRQGGRRALEEGRGKQRCQRCWGGGRRARRCHADAGWRNTEIQPCQQTGAPAGECTSTSSLRGSTPSSSATAGYRLYSRSMDVCKLVVNDGFGPALPSGGALPERDVYDTDQYMLALIYHTRMRRYECLTGESMARKKIRDAWSKLSPPPPDLSDTHDTRRHRSRRAPSPSPASKLPPPPPLPPRPGGLVPSSAARLA
uniref:Uncharacterized protein n=1 Tax=Oryza nivara TaxID=4536 RepID=A0A0E0FJY5_ORYNI